MRLLLDTHAYLWWLTQDRRLASNTLNTILDRRNQLFLSSASAFEIATKVAIGKLKLDGDVEGFILAGMNQGQVRELPILIKHACRVAELPLAHRDPFDRLLIAAAIEEDLTLMTNDPEIRKYPVKTIW